MRACCPIDPRSCARKTTSPPAVCSYPDNILIASIMEQYDKERWQELTRRICEAGVDGFECNFSCPHGHPEKKMGAAMGQNPDIVEEVTGWVVEAAGGKVRQPSRRT
jgi:dihydroorotate dehydrogenase